MIQIDASSWSILSGRPGSEKPTLAPNGRDPNLISLYSGFIKFLIDSQSVT